MPKSESPPPQTQETCAACATQTEYPAATAPAKRSSTPRAFLPSRASHCLTCAPPRSALPPAPFRARCCPASPARCAREYLDPNRPSCACGDSWFTLPLRWSQNPPDRSRQLVPLACLHRQLPPSLDRQPVELCPPIVLRSALFDGNPPSLDQPVQRRIQRPLLDLQHIIRIELNSLGNGMPMRRPQSQRPQNQQVQVPLQQFNPFLALFSRHSR